MGGKDVETLSFAEIMGGNVKDGKDGFPDYEREALREKLEKVALCGGDRSTLGDHEKELSRRIEAILRHMIKFDAKAGCDRESTLWLMAFLRFAYGISTKEFLFLTRNVAKEIVEGRAKTAKTDSNPRMSFFVAAFREWIPSALSNGASPFGLEAMPEMDEFIEKIEKFGDFGTTGNISSPRLSESSKDLDFVVYAQAMRFMAAGADADPTKWEDVIWAFPNPVVGAVKNVSRQAVSMRRMSWMRGVFGKVFNLVVDEEERNRRSRERAKALKAEIISSLGISKAAMEAACHADEGKIRESLFMLPDVCHDPRNESDWNELEVLGSVLFTARLKGIPEFDATRMILALVPGVTDDYDREIDRMLGFPEGTVKGLRHPPVEMMNPGHVRNGVILNFCQNGMSVFHSVETSGCLSGSDYDDRIDKIVQLEKLFGIDTVEAVRLAWACFGMVVRIRAWGFRKSRTGKATEPIEIIYDHVLGNGHVTAWRDGKAISSTMDADDLRTAFSKREFMRDKPHGYAEIVETVPDSGKWLVERAISASCPLIDNLFLEFGEMANRIAESDIDGFLIASHLLACVGVLAEFRARIGADMPDKPMFGKWRLKDGLVRRSTLESCLEPEICAAFAWETESPEFPPIPEKILEDTELRNVVGNLRWLTVLLGWDEIVFEDGDAYEEYLKTGVRQGKPGSKDGDWRKFVHERQKRFVGNIVPILGIAKSMLQSGVPEKIGLVAKGGRERMSADSHDSGVHFHEKTRPCAVPEQDMDDFDISSPNAKEE